MTSDGYEKQKDAIRAKANVKQFDGSHELINIEIVAYNGDLYTAKCISEDGNIHFVDENDLILYPKVKP